MNGELDRAVGQRLLGNAVALLASFELGPLDGVHLQEAAQLLLVAPVTLEVVVLHAAGSQVENRRVSPAGQPDGQASRLAAEQPDGLVGRLRQTQSLAGRAGGRDVFDLGFDLHDVGLGVLLWID